MGDEYEFFEDVSYLIIVDESNGNYVLRPIQTTNLSEYAQNYDMVERQLSSGVTFSAEEITLENKLSTYLAIFINFLIDNPEEAYLLLDDHTKNSYRGYEDFLSQTTSLYQNFSSKIFSYSSREEDDVTIYDVVDDKQNQFVIYEYGIMNFQISY